MFLSNTTTFDDQNNAISKVNAFIGDKNQIKNDHIMILVFLPLFAKWVFKLVIHKIAKTCFKNRFDHHNYRRRKNHYQIFCILIISLKIFLNLLLIKNYWFWSTKKLHYLHKNKFVTCYYCICAWKVISLYRRDIQSAIYLGVPISSFFISSTVQWRE